MDLIWGHISTEPMTCPELKNISLIFWQIQKTSFWFGGHVIPVHVQADNSLGLQIKFRGLPRPRTNNHDIQSQYKLIEHSADNALLLNL